MVVADRLEELHECPNRLPELAGFVVEEHATDKGLEAVFVIGVRPYPAAAELRLTHGLSHVLDEPVDQFLRPSSIGIDLVLIPHADERLVEAVSSRGSGQEPRPAVCRRYGEFSATQRCAAMTHSCANTLIVAIRIRVSSLNLVSCVDVAVIEFGQPFARCSLKRWNSRVVSDRSAGFPPTSFKASRVLSR